MVEKKKKKKRRTKRNGQAEGGTHLVVDVGDVDVVGGLADVAEFGRVFGGHQAAVAHQRLALVRHLVALHVHLVLLITWFVEERHVF